MFIVYTLSAIFVILLCRFVLRKSYVKISSASDRHHWTYEENKYCVEKYFEYFVDCCKSGRIKDATQEIMQKFPSLKESSIQMKFDNIKYLCIISNVIDTYPRKEKEHVSDDNKKAFNEVWSRRKH